MEIKEEIGGVPSKEYQSLASMIRDCEEQINRIQIELEKKISVLQNKVDDLLRKK